jgi:hypothetical protein
MADSRSDGLPPVARQKGAGDLADMLEAVKRIDALFDIRGFALGRKSWLFAGSERGADRAAAVTTLIMTAKLNDIDPLAWLAEVLARIADTPQSQLPDLLPWEWKRSNLPLVA